MRPNKVETAVQCSVCRMWVFAGFSDHGNLINTYIYTQRERERGGGRGLSVYQWSGRPGFSPRSNHTKD